MPGVGAFDHRDARIAADLPVQLRVPDVQGNDMARPALEEHIGEAAGGGANVEGHCAGGVDTERVERLHQLQSTATDPGMVGTDHADLGVHVHHGPRLLRAVPTDVDLPGENQGASLLAGLDQPLVHQQGVEAHPGGHVRRSTIQRAMPARCESRRPAAASASSARARHCAASNFDSSSP